ncbi:hypothetical protein BKA70DRAFT_1366816 [Coprinopsis sp. MPI-PUGE-AT-0042]|nr:hypothetical protein BKA70DRAFT_1366816 [Coprinopsis sp. MPI-PUGE-AT-0042]
MDCKSVKVRCEHVAGEAKCKRCQLKGLPCTPRTRKKRKAAETHDELLERSHQQDLQIQDLLRQYDTKMAAGKINHWINQARPQEPLAWQGKPERPHVPQIVNQCTLYPEEIYSPNPRFFRQPYFSILDERMHTPARLLWHAPFLFTVVCAISSRHLSRRPELYMLAMDFARDAASRAFFDGGRSVEICQAYLLMAVYPTPKKKWLEDRSWLLMGVAISMAKDLGLDQPPPGDCSESEKANRIRTWLNCYCVDESHSIQYGKLPTIRYDDFLARSLIAWYNSSPCNTPYDVHLCGYVEILSVMAGWRSTVSKSPEMPAEAVIDMAISTYGTLERLIEKWRYAYEREYQRTDLPICRYRGNTTRLITAYLQLVVLASGFQASLEQGTLANSQILSLSIQRAHSVIRILVEDLAPTGYLRYAMDANFLYTAFAASFLVNLLRPRLSWLLGPMQRQEIFAATSRLIEVLGSPLVALDAKHTPALYARFLSSSLGRCSLTSYGSSSPSSRTPSVVSEPNDAFFWPDLTHSAATVGSPSALAAKIGDAPNEPYPDHNILFFNLNNFSKNVTEVFNTYSPPPAPSNDWSYSASYGEGPGLTGFGQGWDQTYA